MLKAPGADRSSVDGYDILGSIYTKSPAKAKQIYGEDYIREYEKHLLKSSYDESRVMLLKNDDGTLRSYTIADYVKETYNENFGRLTGKVVIGGEELNANQRRLKYLSEFDANMRKLTNERAGNAIVSYLKGLQQLGINVAPANSDKRKLDYLRSHGFSASTQVIPDPTAPNDLSKAQTLISYDNQRLYGKAAAAEFLAHELVHVAQKQGNDAVEAMTEHCRAMAEEIGLDFDAYSEQIRRAYKRPSSYSDDNAVNLEITAHFLGTVLGTENYIEDLTKLKTQDMAGIQDFIHDAIKIDGQNSTFTRHLRQIEGTIASCIRGDYAQNATALALVRNDILAAIADEAKKATTKSYVRTKEVDVVSADETLAALAGWKKYTNVSNPSVVFVPPKGHIKGLTEAERVAFTTLFGKDPSGNKGRNKPINEVFTLKNPEGKKYKVRKRGLDTNPIYAGYPSSGRITFRGSEDAVQDIWNRTGGPSLDSAEMLESRFTKEYSAKPPVRLNKTQARQDKYLQTVTANAKLELKDFKLNATNSITGLHASTFRYLDNTDRNGKTIRHYELVFDDPYKGAPSYGSEADQLLKLLGFHKVRYQVTKNKQGWKYVMAESKNPFIIQAAYAGNLSQIFTMGNHGAWDVASYTDPTQEAAIEFAAKNSKGYRFGNNDSYTLHYYPSNDVLLGADGYQSYSDDGFNSDDNTFGMMYIKYQNRTDYTNDKYRNGRVNNHRPKGLGSEFTYAKLPGIGEVWAAPFNLVTFNKMVGGEHSGSITGSSLVSDFMDNYNKQLGKAGSLAIAIPTENGGHDEGYVDPSTGKVYYSDGVELALGKYYIDSIGEPRIYMGKSVENTKEVKAEPKFGNTVFRVTFDDGRVQLVRNNQSSKFADVDDELTRGAVDIFDKLASDKKVVSIKDASDPNVIYFDRKSENMPSDGLGDLVYKNLYIKFKGDDGYYPFGSNILRDYFITDEHGYVTQWDPKVEKITTPWNRNTLHELVVTKDEKTGGQKVISKSISYEEWLRRNKLEKSDANLKKYKEALDKQNVFNGMLYNPDTLYTPGSENYGWKYSEDEDPYADLWVELDATTVESSKLGLPIGSTIKMPFRVGVLDDQALSYSRTNRSSKAEKRAIEAYEEVEKLLADNSGDTINDKPRSYYENVLKDLKAAITSARGGLVDFRPKNIKGADGKNTAGVPSVRRLFRKDSNGNESVVFDMDATTLDGKNLGFVWYDIDLARKLTHDLTGFAGGEGIAEVDYGDDVPEFEVGEYNAGLTDEAANARSDKYQIGQAKESTDNTDDFFSGNIDFQDETDASYDIDFNALFNEPLDFNRDDMEVASTSATSSYDYILDSDIQSRRDVANTGSKLAKQISAENVLAEDVNLVQTSRLADGPITSDYSQRYSITCDEAPELNNLSAQYDYKSNAIIISVSEAGSEFAATTAQAQNFLDKWGFSVKNKRVAAKELRRNSGYKNAAEKIFTTGKLAPGKRNAIWQALGLEPINFNLNEIGIESDATRYIKQARKGEVLLRDKRQPAGKFINIDAKSEEQRESLTRNIVKLLREGKLEVQSTASAVNNAVFTDTSPEGISRFRAIFDNKGSGIAPATGKMTDAEVASLMGRLGEALDQRAQAKYAETDREKTIKVLTEKLNSMAINAMKEAGVSKPQLTEEQINRNRIKAENYISFMALEALDEKSFKRREADLEAERINFDYENYGAPGSPEFELTKAKLLRLFPEETGVLFTADVADAALADAADKLSIAKDELSFNKNSINIQQSILKQTGIAKANKTKAEKTLAKLQERTATLESKVAKATEAFNTAKQARASINQETIDKQFEAVIEKYAPMYSVIQGKIKEVQKASAEEAQARTLEAQRAKSELQKKREKFSYPDKLNSRTRNSLKQLYPVETEGMNNAELDAFSQKMRAEIDQRKAEEARKAKADAILNEIIRGETEESRAKDEAFRKQVELNVARRKVFKGYIDKLGIVAGELFENGSYKTKMPENSRWANYTEGTVARTFLEAMLPEDESAKLKVPTKGDYDFAKYLESYSPDDIHSVKDILKLIEDYTNVVTPLPPEVIPMYQVRNELRAAARGQAENLVAAGQEAKYRDWLKGIDTASDEALNAALEQIKSADADASTIQSALDSVYSDQLSGAYDSLGSVLSKKMYEGLKDNSGGRDINGSFQPYRFPRGLNPVETEYGTMYHASAAKSSKNAYAYLDINNPLIIGGKYETALVPGVGRSGVSAVGEAIMSLGWANAENISAELKAAKISGAGTNRKTIASDTIERAAKYFSDKQGISKGEAFKLLTQEMGYDGIQVYNSASDNYYQSFVFDESQIVPMNSSPQDAAMGYLSIHELRNLSDSLNGEDVGETSGPVASAPDVVNPMNGQVTSKELVNTSKLRINQFLDKMITYNKPTAEAARDLSEMRSHLEMGVREVLHDSEARNRAAKYTRGLNAAEAFGKWVKDVGEGLLGGAQGIANTVSVYSLLTDEASRTSDESVLADLNKARYSCIGFIDEVKSESGRTLRFATGFEAHLARIIGDSPELSFRHAQAWLKAFNKREGINLAMPAEIADMFKNAKDDDARLNAIDALAKYAADNTPKNFLKEFDSLRIWGMLSAPATSVRNICANVINTVNYMLKDAAAGVISDESNATEKYNSFRNCFKSSAPQKLVADWDNVNALSLKQWELHEAEVMSGTKYKDTVTEDLTNKYNEYYNPFTVKGFKKVADYTFDGLEIADEYGLKGAVASIFPGKTRERIINSNLPEFSGLKWHYQTAFRNYIRANEYTTEFLNKSLNVETAKSDAERAEALRAAEALAKANAHAIKEAKAATFRADSPLADILNKFKNTKGDNLLHSAAQLALKSNMPFTGVPINVAKSAEKFSPLSFAEALRKESDLRRSKNNDVESRFISADVIDDVASGMEGSVLWALGAILAAAGILRSTNSDDDEKADSFLKSMGNQVYAVVFGDGSSYTIDWATPTSISLFAGVEMYNSLANTDTPHTLASFINTLFNIGAKAAGPMLEMSFMQGITNFMDSWTYGGTNPAERLATASKTMVTNYLTQPYPNVLAKLANGIDPSVYSTYAPKDSEFVFGKEGESALRKVANKIPFAKGSYNAPSYDLWGQKRTNAIADGNILANLAYSLYSPGYYSGPSDTAELDDKVMKLATKTGNSSIIPTAPQKSFSYTSKDENGVSTTHSIVYNNEDFSRASMVQGSKTKEYYEEFMASDLYTKLDDEAKADVLAKVRSYATTLAKVDYCLLHSISDYSGIGEWMEMKALNETYGVEVGEYYALKNIIKAYTGKGAAAAKRKALRDMGYSDYVIDAIL